MVDFNQINPTYKLPGTSAEVDPSQAGTPVSDKWGLIAGFKTAAGSAPADLPIAVGTQADADAFFGAGSMLARMFTVWFAVNRTSPLVAIPIAEPGAGVAATGTITVSNAASAAGTLYLYIAGQRVSVGISASDTTAQVATKIAAAINAVTALPVTAAAATNVVTLTCRWKGLIGNDISMGDSYRGFYGGEFRPAGLALTYSGSGFLASGTGVPDWPNAIASLGDDPYRFVALPTNDSGSFTVWDTEYGFTDSGRWGWMRQSYGQIFSAKRDTYSNLFVYGPTNNSPVIHPMAVEVGSPTPIWEWTAAYAARAAQAFTIDPAAPLQTLTLAGCLPAPKGQRFSKTQLNALAGVGLSIQGTDVDGPTGGVPQILREQSSYQKNSYGVADNAFQVATTLATLDVILTRLRQSATNKYPRHKLADNGTRFGPGKKIVTPAIIKGELIAEYSAMEYDGLVENIQAFKKALVVERSTVDPNTVECLYPPDLINQLRRFNVRAQFRLQFPAAA
ncbi:phage tail sheath C-terminal domain-containing protein [Chelatococcus reniformis]|uniref:Tail sheath protein n=1 Tax=Chelatococcus reniformis TaxID=1494448 RepID=A0A916XFQ2_9HYPH|nr:phage tail sheath C-terminal domain-containing protein [Chelatococcus reniformis]GGC68556.1 tail sheath protein [Chelatococcus reniformis]